VLAVPCPRSALSAAQRGCGRSQKEQDSSILRDAAPDYGHDEYQRPAIATPTWGGIREKRIHGDLSLDLCSPALDDLGLLPALEGLTADPSQKEGVEATPKAQGDRRRLSPEAELASFRITQEALPGVGDSDHSGARRIQNQDRHHRAASFGLSIDRTTGQPTMTALMPEPWGRARCTNHCRAVGDP